MTGDPRSMAAIAFAGEGADVAIAYLNESGDAQETIGWIEKAGRRALALPGDLADRNIFATNDHAMFNLTQAAVAHMKPGAAIINTASVNADMPMPSLLTYSTAKGAIANFTGGLGQLLAKQGIRVNAVAPGPIWTPLIPSTMSPEDADSFGSQTSIGRPGQPAELAAAYVLLASSGSSYMSGSIIPVTGGKPIL